MKSRVTLLLLLGYLAAVFRTEAAEESVAKVVVLDFAMDAATSQGADWASGAADLVEVELARQGIEVLERRQIRLILGERRDYRGGLLSRDSLKAEGLARPRAFMIGTFFRTAAKHFKLQAKLMSVQDGTDLASASAEGSYPEDWMKALCTVAGSLVAAVPRIEREPARKEPLPGASRNPEAAADFYRGLALFTEGKTEEAWFTFHHARQTDPDFHLAEAWEMRTLDDCGMPEHAAVLREDLAQYPAEDSIAGMTAASQLKSKGNAIWIIDAEPGIPDSWIRSLKEGLQKEAHVRFFDPARVGDLAREADLQWSGEMATKGTPDPFAWMGAGCLLKIRIGADGLGISLHDIATGQRRVYMEATDADPPNPKLLSALALAGAAGTNAIRSTEAGAFCESEPSEWARQALWNYRRHPNDPRAVARLRGMFLGGTSRYENGRHDYLVMERLGQLLDSTTLHDSPEAAFWLSYIQLLRYCADADIHSVPGQRCCITVSLVEVFKPVLDRYSNSLAANVARYSMAQELRLAGKHEESARLLETVWKDLSTDLVGKNLVQGEYLEVYQADVGFALASELGLCGRNKEALDVIQKALVTSRMHVVFSRSPLWTVPLAWPERKDGWSLVSAPNYTCGLEKFEAPDSSGIKPAMVKLRDRLRSGPLQGSTPTLGPNDLLEKARAVSGHDAARYYLQFMEQSLRELKDGERPQPAFFAALAWLNLECLPPEDMADVSNFLAKASGRLASGRDLYFLFAAAGQPDAAAHAMQEWVNTSVPEEKIESIVEAAVFHSIAYSPAASRAFLKRETDQLLSTNMVRTDEVVMYQRDRIWDLSTALVNAVLPDEFERLWRKQALLDGANALREWPGVAAYLRGDTFEATEYCRKVIEENTKADRLGDGYQAGALLGHLRTYGSGFNDIALATPVAPPRNAWAVSRAMELHMEAREQGWNYWYEQAQRHLRESGTNTAAVWIRLLQNPGIGVCGCYFAVVLEQPPSNGIEAVIPCMERLLAQWDDGRGGSLASATAAALGYIGPPAVESAPLLIASLAHEGSCIANNARWALGRTIRPPARCAPRLAMLLKYPDPKVRIMAAQALTVIDGVPPDIARNVADDDLPAKLQAWWDSDASRAFRSP